MPFFYCNITFLIFSWSLPPWEPRFSPSLFPLFPLLSSPILLGSQGRPDLTNLYKSYSQHTDSYGTQNCNTNFLIFAKKVNKLGMNALSSSSCTFDTISLSDFFSLKKSKQNKTNYLHTSLKSVTISIGTSISFAMSVS